MNPREPRDSFGDCYYLTPNNKALLNPWSPNPRALFLQLLWTHTCPIHQPALMHGASTKREQTHMIPHADLQRTTNSYVISISNYLRLWLFPFKLLEEIFSSKLQNSCQLLFVERIWAARTNEKENVFWAVKSALLQHKTIPKFFLIKARSKFSTQHYKKLFYSSLSCPSTNNYCKGNNLYLLLGGNGESLRSLPNCSCSTTTRFP